MTATNAERHLGHRNRHDAERHLGHRTATTPSGLITVRVDLPDLKITWGPKAPT
jgi:hypothetical protein